MTSAWDSGPDNYLGAELMSYEGCNYSAVGGLGIFFGRKGWKVRGSKE